VITPNSPDRLYSTRLRTALVLAGSGTAGAYHAGVLRALHEAGVRIDLVAGRGMGAVSAMFAAIDGGARLWEPSGIWKSRAVTSLYEWRSGLRIGTFALLAAGTVLLFPLLLLALAVLVGLVGFALTPVGLDETGSALTGGFTARLGSWFSSGGLPLVVPRLVLLGVLVAAVAVAARLVGQAARRGPRRRMSRGLLWRLVGHPLTSSHTSDTFAAQLWSLIRGAAPLQRPRNAELGKKYIELLADNLGQPGFRELLIVVHDLDARQDLVAAFLRDQHRPRFFGRLLGAGTARAGEALDLAGVAREHTIDVMSAALTLPVATEPHLITFASEGPWRGETHRLCDRPGALTRVFEELASAGAEQVIVLATTPRVARPHELSAGRGDVRGHAGEQLAAFETAGLRDVLEQFAGRFAGLYLIRPDHNPVGPFDFAGVYDERSDRRYTVPELVDRGYEDAYRQFIDPVIGASGERIQSVTTS
jgi:Patatin-like phospholipase